MQDNSEPKYYSAVTIEQRYKTLQAAFDNYEPSFVIDQVGTIIEANKAFAAIFGKEVHEVINCNVFDFFPPELAASRKGKVEEAFQTAKRVIFEDERDGQVIRNTIYPIPDSNGTITQLYITAQDITELRMAEKEALKSNIVSSVLVEQIPGAFLIMDGSGRVVQWNAHERDVIAGKSESEMANTLLMETIHPDDRSLVGEKISSLFQSDHEDSAEVRILIHGGPEFRWYKISAKRIIINDTPYLIGIASDFTDHKLAEDAALQHSEDRFKTLFAEHSAVKLIIDASTANIIDANQAAADFYGWSIEELRSMNMVDINTTCPEQAQLAIEKSRLSGTHPVIFQHRLADGSFRTVEAYATKINVEGKDVFYAIIHDITLQKQMHDELVAAKEKAEETDRLKSAFLATITHELRTPMNGILGFSELLMDPELPQEESVEFIDLIHQSGLRLLTLINELIDLARIEAGETMVQQDDTNVNMLLKDLTAFFKLEIHKKGLRLTCTPGLSDSESIIKTDSAKLTQVLTNLVNNALKFTFTGGIDIGYTMQNGILEFYVKDSGIGIPVAMQEKIFERFIQVDNPLTRQIEGSGLGLSIAKGYVAMLGGAIRLESVEGEGTTFTFTIPYNQTTSTYLGILAPSLLVLIADDDDITRTLFKKILKDENMTLLYAFNGQEAVDLAERHPEIDMVLMDIKMPLLNGYEAARQIKKRRPNLPIIAQSALTAPEELEKAIQAGCDRFIKKPINKGELLEVIHSTLNR